MQRRGSNRTKREAVRHRGESPDRGKVNPPMLSRPDFPSALAKVVVLLAPIVALIIIVGSVLGPSAPATTMTAAPQFRSSVNDIPPSTIARYQMLTQNLARHAEVVSFEDAQFAAAVVAHQVHDYLVAVSNQRVARYLAATHALEVAAAAATQAAESLAAAHAQAVQAAASQAELNAISTPPTAPSAAPTAGNPAGDTVTAFQRAAWDKVNICEESGRWNVDGAAYSGGLGFTHANWTQFNTFGFPADAAYATPDQQIQVATAFAFYYWHSADAAPDQSGCGGGY
jgi:Transglycosylase-like domain